VNVEATELPLQAADITPPEQIFHIIDQEVERFQFSQSEEFATSMTYTQLCKCSALPVWDLKLHASSLISLQCSLTEDGNFFLQCIPSCQCVLENPLHHGPVVGLPIAAPSPVSPSLPVPVLSWCLSAAVLPGFLHPAARKP